MTKQGAMICKDNLSPCVDDSLSFCIPSISPWEKINCDIQKVVIQKVSGFPLVNS